MIFWEVEKRINWMVEGGAVNDHQIGTKRADEILITPFPIDRLIMQTTRWQEIVFLQRDFNFLRVAAAIVAVIRIVNAAARGGIHEHDYGIDFRAVHEEGYGTRDCQQQHEHGCNADPPPSGPRPHLPC